MIFLQPAVFHARPRSYFVQSGLMKASRNKFIKMVSAIGHCLVKPALLRRTLAGLYNERLIHAGSIPRVTIEALGIAGWESRLVDFVPEQGNVTVVEMLCLCLMARAYGCRNVLELGTFNGNTTLQLAANLSDGAAITTLDLPLESTGVSANNSHDSSLVVAEARQRHRYEGTAYAERITQVYGNSLEADFSTLCSAAPDFIFIDAGHSDECVRNDTETSLRILAPGGIIVWHDYSQDWPDVYDYLEELSVRLALRHVEGTTLVVFRSPS